MQKVVGALLAGGAVVASFGYVWVESTRALPEAKAIAVATSSVTAATAPQGPSSIARDDYVGAESCRECHEAKLATWEAHPHRRMNQDVSPATMKGDFSGVTIAYSTGTVTFSRGPEGYLMTLEKAGKLFRKYVVTRVVGSRFMQFYIGRELVGPEPAGHKAYSEEHKLGFGYWFKRKEWLPVSYFDPVGAETKPDGTPAYDPFESPRVHIWRQNCMLCHNTVPWLYRLALPDGLEGFPQLEHQLAAAPLLAEISRTIDLAPHPDDPVSVKGRIHPENLVTLGISCEACHFGCKEHVKTNGNAPTSYLPQSPFVRWVERDSKKPVVSDTKDARVMNGVCAQCHCATVTLYPNGAGTWNSREATDMIGGACASKIRCTDCHDPHRNDGHEGLPTSHAHVAVCTKCHEKYKDASLARAHSKHESVTCLDCHMPRMTQGLEEVVRTHRISSPTDVRMLENGSGNACNLCHLDEPIGWTLDRLREQYGKAIAPTTSWSAFYGEKLEKPVGIAWLEGKDPSMRLVATQAYARSPLGKGALKELVRELEDPIAVNRVFDTFAIGRIIGRELSREEFDVTAPASERKARVAWLAKSLALEASREPARGTGSGVPR